ncbi:hypothetical protein JHK87_031417 [Glycine soja]|nr:hypothetical protein JHK87_031417 [Glycine soja]
MDSSRHSVVIVAFLLAFSIMASDICIKSEARGPIYKSHCDKDFECRVGCHNIMCGCRAVCIDHVCQCPHPISTNNNIPGVAPPN